MFCNWRCKDVLTPACCLACECWCSCSCLQACYSVFLCMNGIHEFEWLGLISMLLQGRFLREFDAMDFTSGSERKTCGCLLSRDLIPLFFVKQFVASKPFFFVFALTLLCLKFVFSVWIMHFLSIRWVFYTWFLKRIFVLAA